ncbi:MAG: 3-keto-5-aminohexanoate cleavage protein [Myxococcaceae bacterium]|nr:MAG: 3-keto-5-aminohexanoate cleavage protein [Myxococcaceae bacterium]
MSTPMLITAAMVGAETTREQTPYLPITAEEIAEDAVKCREAGAAMVHLHVRTADGKPSQDADGLRPELECFDVGMIDEARYLAKEGLVELPAHFDFVLGVPGTLQARPEVLDFMIASLPEGCTWTVAGVGRQQLPFVDEAAKRGGNTRVGLEDNIYLSKGVLAKGNHELVAEAAKRARAHGRELATPEQARQLLRLG